MNQSLEILITAGVTLLGGLILYLISKYIDRRYLSLFDELDEIRGELTVSMVFNANVYGHVQQWSTTEVSRASNELRNFSGRLRGALFKARRTPLFSKLYEISIKDLALASSELIGLSNAAYGNDFTHINDRIENIRKYLKIEV